MPTASGVHSQTAGSQARKRQQNDNILLPLFPPSRLSVKRIHHAAPSFGVSDRPTCLTFCCIKMSRTLNESIRVICFSSAEAEVQLINAAATLKLYCGCKDTTQTPPNQIFQPSISHLHFFRPSKIAGKPFIYRHFHHHFQRFNKVK